MSAVKRTWAGKFGDSFRGLFRAVSTESSFAAHLPGAAAAVGCGWFFGLSAGEWCLVAIAIGAVLAAETFNSSIEMLAKALDRGPDERIRDALDMASGAVLVTVGTAIVVGLVLFVPRLLALVR
jgi:diacylglycerol kinase (ATP)